jgi:hypothetical protein
VVNDLHQGVNVLRGAVVNVHKGAAANVRRAAANVHRTIISASAAGLSAPADSVFPRVVGDHPEVCAPDKAGVRPRQRRSERPHVHVAR